MITLGRNHMPANNAPVFNSVQSTGTREHNKQMYDNIGSSTTKQEHQGTASSSIRITPLGEVAIQRKQQSTS